MKKIIYCLLLFPLLVSAQKPVAKITWGEVLSNSGVGFSHMVKCGKDQFVTANFPKDGDGLTYITYNTSTLEEVSRKVVPRFEYQGSNAGYDYSFPFKEGILILYSVYNKDNNTEYFLSRYWERGDLGPIKELGSLERKGSENITTNVKFSKDSSKVLFYAVHPGKRKENYVLTLSVFDSKLEQVWSEVATFPYETKDLYLDHSAVTNDGKAFISTKAYTKSDLAKRPLDAVKIFEFPAKGDRIKELRFSLKGKYATNIRLIPDFNEDQMAVVGTISDDFVGNVAGTFYGLVDQVRFIAKPFSVDKFDPAMQQEFEDLPIGFVSRELNAYDLEQVVPNESGGLSLILQRDYYRNYENRETGEFEYTKYWKETILVLELDQRGGISNHSLVHKQQVAKEATDYLSYLMVPGEDGLHFIYNDNDKTVERLEKGKKPADMYVARKSSVTLATALEQETVYQTLFLNKEKEAVLTAKLSQPAGTNAAILVNIRGNRLQFASLFIE